MQQHQSSSSQHSNIPGKMPNWNQSLPNDSSMNYNDPSMNMMNSGMPRSSGGGGGYHDGNYHDVQSNRYETHNQFNIKFIDKTIYIFIKISI